MINKLKIVSTEKKPSSNTRTFKPKTFREEVQARFEREWHQNPKQFDSKRNALERQRIQRTLDIIEENMSLQGILVADLGCGEGELAKILRDKGAKIHAVDIAKNALHTLDKEPNIKAIHSCVPNTHLEDNDYDLVVCTELIAHLSSREHRLFFNELARLVKKDGYIVCSTSVDIHSDDALERFVTLAETELEIVKWKFSFHRLHILLKNFFKTPEYYALVSKNIRLKEGEMQERKTLSKLWFRLNSSKALGFFWGLIAKIANPIANIFKKNSVLLNTLEKISKSDSSISHVIILAQRKPIEF